MFVRTDALPTPLFTTNTLGKIPYFNVIYIITVYNTNEHKCKM